LKKKKLQQLKQLKRQRELQSNMMFPKEGKKKRNKNTPARFSQKTKEQIFERDNRRCIFSSQEKPWQCSNVLQFHHVAFGFEAERGTDRNNIEKGVTLCDKCHHEPHHGVTEFVKIIREFCKNYLKKYYGKL